MSVFSPRTLFTFINSGRVVRGLAQRETEAPEGAGFDLRLDFASQVSGDAFLGVSTRYTGEAKRLLPKMDGEAPHYMLYPGDYVLLTTMEEVDLPSDMVGFLWPRTTVFRSGAVLSTGVIAPGYHGVLTVGCSFSGGASLRLEVGARFLHLVIMSLDQAGYMYRGQWQDGRVYTPEPEVQL